jgi:hypothetical protein
MLWAIITVYEQIKLLELEKASTQNNLDDVCKLVTQQKNTFTKKYEEVNDYETLLFLLIYAGQSLAFFPH